MSGRNTTPKHPGVPVMIGEVEYIMPAMLFATRNRIKAAEEALASGAKGFDQDTLVGDVVLETLQRNYPELTMDELTKGATFEELMAANLTMQFEEARRMAELGKQMAAQMIGLRQSLSTSSSPQLFVSSVAAGNSGSESSTSPG